MLLVSTPAGWVPGAWANPDAGGWQNTNWQLWCAPFMRAGKKRNKAGAGQHV